MWCAFPPRNEVGSTCTNRSIRRKLDLASGIGGNPLDIECPILHTTYFRLNGAHPSNNLVGGSVVCNVPCPLSPPKADLSPLSCPVLGFHLSPCYLACTACLVALKSPNSYSQLCVSERHNASLHRAERTRGLTAWTKPLLEPDYLDLCDFLRRFLQSGRCFPVSL